MTQKIKNLLLSAMMLLTMATPALVPLTVASAAANCNAVAGGVRDGANAATGGNAINCQPPSSAPGGIVGETARKIVNIFSIVVGATAVIMIIVGGFRYITSGGSSERVGGAKNTLIYAIIGLIIVALAQLIVHFVLSQANNVGT